MSGNYSFNDANPTGELFSKPKRKEKRLVESENLERISEEIKMQTLTAGSFLNFENAANLEALKFTARRLAEMTANVAACAGRQEIFRQVENLVRRNVFLEISELMKIHLLLKLVGS